MRRLFISVTMALLLVMVPVATAFADGGVPVLCSVTPIGMDPGDNDIDLDDNEIVQSDASIELLVLCASGGLTGILVTDHGSEVEYDPATGEFSGELEGTYTLYDFLGGVIGTGELEADVSGVLVVAYLDFDMVVAIEESFVGEWDLEGEGLEGEGEFTLDLDFVDFDPFGGSLTGEVELDGDDGDDDD